MAIISNVDSVTEPIYFIGETEPIYFMGEYNRLKEAH